MNEKTITTRSNDFMEGLGYYYALQTIDAHVRIPLEKNMVCIDCIYKRKDFTDVVLLENTSKDMGFEEIRSHFGRLAYALAVYGCKGILACHSDTKSYLPDLREWSKVVFLNPDIEKRMFFLFVGDKNNTKFELLDINGKRRGGEKEW